ncbi:Detected protein of confused Function [Hibiscus syriacus]|uniref:Detected protein of confused Function n=1 Tax=Hibiscus syriacus TaxID=106335 RepID=A0A6A3CXW6_HIBSY|nr:Detected protein of confused Function [Hibiscus syriacus]
MKVAAMGAIDFLMPYFLHLVVLYVRRHHYLLYKYKSSATLNLPPGRKGLPYIGETLDYVLASRWGTPEKFITDRTTKYSPDVFRTSLLGEDMAIFCGAAGNKFLFSGQNKYVTSWWPDSIKKALMDPASVDNSSKEESTKLRAYLPPFLKPDPSFFKKYTFALACRLFMSVTDPDEIENFAKPFALATAGLISVPIDLPGTTFNRAVKAGRQIRQQLSPHYEEEKEISEKRKKQRHQTCHDTTSTAITFIVSYLSDHPDVYNRVLEEQMEVLRGKEGGDEALRWEDTDEVYVAFWTVHTTNKNPKYFPYPERFDPSRFEGNGPAPYTFVPFGGGPRMCPGKEYARLEILTFIHNSSPLTNGSKAILTRRFLTFLHPFLRRPSRHDRNDAKLIVHPSNYYLNKCVDTCWSLKI